MEDSRYLELTSSNGGKPTVDGKNPAPVDMVNIPVSTGFYASQVVQEFFHQQYVPQIKRWIRNG